VTGMGRMGRRGRASYDWRRAFLASSATRARCSGKGSAANEIEPAMKWRRSGDLTILLLPR
jgi:hypothetical protein